jgi:hypothetical protein
MLESTNPKKNHSEEWFHFNYFAVKISWQLPEVHPDRVLLVRELS